jgi:hypothetical protein
MQRLGVQVGDLTKLTGKLDQVPTEQQVQSPTCGSLLILLS